MTCTLPGEQHHTKLNSPLLNVCCCHIRYIPSEVLQGTVTDLHKADMFMLGITMYELVTLQDLPTGNSCCRICCLVAAVLLFVAVTSC